ncbi:methionyl-tRNA formyltransferase [Metamycoplasma hyosynoviae]|uniref:methionyl-tRNA formyltransferase n=1 Tax=Metamycoplasma hyosynoviae TaxID=29559 RepID=UPI0020C92E05|nr:methionyl-tRNA formyltransferase [Metamycoplasma hyosynoviae]MDC8899996.1 methionyl-tRNA formyltransferase [Metamycoplasma hyosynoviae]MDC8917605.1 methionyl-tRNA formyltransferase [Metamycoplasma hyosynoviae]MDC8963257.1 methionyl-tRNA formyltransferase [Metamycoplasma hyosynoviae]MDD1359131.1 methionyl-tRNA formyltransferase [Metamycoplasma hyosynoviae]MDD1372609.1 methionyl-tRNA formyltransferase [Metamycoplasma hyosynoviae]
MQQKNKLKLVLAGTGEFSKNIFESLINNENFEVLALVSQPNNSVDRNKNPIKTPVALLAEKYNIPLFQPIKIKEIKDKLITLNYDFFITAAFGQFIPNSVLEIAKIASINVHGSLLEKYRGAAPIQHTLLNNEKETGISLIYMIDRMDAGDIIGTARCEILEQDTALEIFDKLANLTIKNLPNWLIQLSQNKIKAIKQDESKATLAPKIKNEDAEIFLSQTKEEALSKIKAFNDQPGAFIIINNKRLKIFRASLTKIKTPLSLDFSNGKLYLVEYQFEGKKKVKHEI